MDVFRWEGKLRLDGKKCVSMEATASIQSPHVGDLEEVLPREGGLGMEE